MLDVIDLACRRGERQLFSQIGFSVGPGHLLSVLGRNGSGKTSLLRLLCGLSSPDEGTISWQGTRIRQLRELYFAQLLYVGHLHGIKDDLTGVENLQISGRLAGKEISPASARGALEAVGLRGCGHLPTRVLSQGQRRLVALARLWLSDCPLWLLDEPFAALDAQARSLLAAHLATHLKGGGMIVLTSHEDLDIPADSARRLRLTG